MPKHKVTVLCNCLQACSTDVSLCWAERWQAMGTTLAAQLCLAYLTLDAIHEENGLQLLTSTSFTVLSGLLWLIFVVGAEEW
jgi:hypothetical protein